MRHTLIALSVSVAVLAACGGSDDDASSAASADDAPTTDPAVASSDATTFRGELEDGTTLTIELAVGETDPSVAPFVEFRERVGAADEVAWITASLEVPADYDDATGPPTGRYLTFVQPGGDLIDETNPTSSFACGELDEWFANADPEDQELFDLYVSLLEQSCDNQPFGVVGEIGATTEYVMVVTGSEIPAFDSVYAGLLTELEPVG